MQWVSLFKFNNRCLEPISRNSVLVMFNVSLLAASQARILSKSRLIQLFISSALLPTKVILVSSAYILGCIWRAREPPEKKKRPQMCRLSHFVLNDLVLSLLSLKCPFHPVLFLFCPLQLRVKFAETVLLLLRSRTRGISHGASARN